MTLNKNKMVRETGRRTRLRNHDVQRVVETLMEIWMEELSAGGRIELQNFLVLEVQQIDRGERRGEIKSGPVSQRFVHRLTVRSSKQLKAKLSRIGTQPKPT